MNVLELFFGQVSGYVLKIVKLITGNPALIILVFGMGIVGFTVGLLRRLVNVN